MTEVRVTAGDYTYDGWQVAEFSKRSGQVRCVVEDEHGRLFIHRPSQIAALPNSTEAKVTREQPGNKLVP